MIKVNKGVFVMLSRRPWAYERGTLWAMDIDRDALGSVLPSGATLGEVQHETQSEEALAAAMGFSSIAPVTQRFGAGSRCFVAWVAAGIAAYGWVSEEVERIGELERPFHMENGEAYIWDCATLPAYRQQGLYSMLLRHITVTLGSEGLRRLWIGASLHNQPSIRGIAAAGFQPVINLTYARLFTFERVFVTAYPTASQRLVTQARRGLVAPIGKY